MTTAATRKMCSRLYLPVGSFVGVASDVSVTRIDAT